MKVFFFVCFLHFGLTIAILYPNGLKKKSCEVGHKSLELIAQSVLEITLDWRYTQVLCKVISLWGRNLEMRKCHRQKDGDASQETIPSEDQADLQGSAPS